MNQFLYTMLGGLENEPIPSYDDVFGLSDPRDPMRDGFDKIEETQLPFIVNVVNHEQDQNDYPLPIRHDLTLREFVAHASKGTRFYNNQGLFKGFVPPTPDLSSQNHHMSENADTDNHQEESKQNMINTGGP